MQKALEVCPVWEYNVIRVIIIIVYPGSVGSCRDDEIIMSHKPTLEYFFKHLQNRAVSQFSLELIVF